MIREDPFSSRELRAVFLHTWRTRATVKGAHGVQTLYHGRTGATTIIGQTFIHILTAVAVSMPTWHIIRSFSSDSKIHLEHSHELLSSTVGTFHRWMAYSINYFFLLYMLFRDFPGNYVILILVKWTFCDQLRVLHWNIESKLEDNLLELINKWCYQQGRNHSRKNPEYCSKEQQDWWNRVC